MGGRARELRENPLRHSGTSDELKHLPWEGLEAEQLGKERSPEAQKAGHKTRYRADHWKLWDEGNVLYHVLGGGYMSV